MTSNIRPPSYIGLKRTESEIILDMEIKIEHEETTNLVMVFKIYLKNSAANFQIPDIILNKFFKNQYWTALILDVSPIGTRLNCKHQTNMISE
jgi:hypothetical protein